MRRCDVRHEDPAPRARAAAVRSAREQDAETRRRARAQTPAERLREGMSLSRFASRLTERAPRPR